MPNIATALKAEISRLARKELRSNTDALKKAVSHYRSEIAALKRRVQQLERQQQRLARARPAARDASDAEEEQGPRHRFSAKGFASTRQRLGLSAAAFGRLIGVSQLSVYKWEQGQQHPRQRYLPAIAQVRKMGKREAAARLAQLGDE